MRVMIAGTKSGAGKTSITCGLIHVLKRHGYTVSALKCGPDYIDPMFHRKVLKIPSGNIDCFLSDAEDCLKHTALKESQTDILIMEGVMGYYDGIGFTSRGGSSDIAQMTSTPVLLIVDAEGSAKSVMAVLRGFVDMDVCGLIKAVIFNRMSENIYLQAVEEIKKLGIIPCGYVPKDSNFVLDSRHLGLKLPSEISDFSVKLGYIADLLEKTLDMAAVLSVLKQSSTIKEDLNEAENKIDKIRIGVSCDEAFCFLYDDLWEAFDKNGIEPVLFSPISDRKLPDGISGIYLCGGYPENHLKQLSENKGMLKDIRKAFELKMPMIAECGGFMYLHEKIEDENGKNWPLVGVIKGGCKKAERLQHFGYGILKFQKNCLIGKKGENLPIHSFHYYTSTSMGADCEITKASDQSSWNECTVYDWFYGGFPHFFMQGNRRILNSFYTACKNWQEGNR